MYLSVCPHVSMYTMYMLDILGKQSENWYVGTGVTDSCDSNMGTGVFCKNYKCS